MTPEQLERKREQAREYHANNPERYRKYWRKYRLAHRAEINRRACEDYKKWSPEKYGKKLHQNRKLRHTLQRDNPALYLWKNTKQRAAEHGREFSISVADIKIPRLCRYLKLPLFFTIGKRTDNMPTIDRIDSSLGYIKGNIEVISYKANTLKRDATLEDMVLMGRGAQSLINKQKRKDRK